MTVWYCAFLYGVNIPGGRKISMTTLPSLLANLASGFQYQGSVGNSGNLLFTCPQGASRSLQAIVKNYLGVECVVRDLPDLRRCRQKVSQCLGSLLIQKNGAIWEVGVVLLSDPLPNGCPNSVWQYSQKNAESLCLLDPGTVLVLKRKVTSNGNRIMFGSTVLAPLRRQLQQQQISLGCLTSRSLGIIQMIMDRANRP